VLGEAADIDTLKHIVISDKNHSPIYLQDVALIEDGFEDTRTIARIDGVPLQAMSVLKQRGSNAVTVAGDVRKAIDELKKSLHKAWSSTYSSTRRNSFRIPCTK